MTSHDYYSDWQEQLAIASQNDGVDYRISAILSLAKSIYDSAEQVNREVDEKTGSALYRIPQYHMIRLGGMLYNGMTE